MRMLRILLLLAVILVPAWLFFSPSLQRDSSAAPKNDEEQALNSPSLQQFQGDGKTFVLVDPLQYQIKATGKVITVPPGFVTDFASVPGIAQSVISVLGQHSVPAIVHDYLYWDQQCARSEADDILYDAMEEYKSTWFQKTVVYRAVRLGASSAWAENTEERKQGLPRVIPLTDGKLPANAVWTTYRKELFDKGVKAEPFPAESAPKPAYCSLMK